MNHFLKLAGQGVGKRIPIPMPALEKMNPNPNPKSFQMRSQSQNFQNSIPIPKIPQNPKQSQEILGIPNTYEKHERKSEPPARTVQLKTKLKTHSLAEISYRIGP